MFCFLLFFKVLAEVRTDIARKDIRGGGKKREKKKEGKRKKERKTSQMCFSPIGFTKLSIEIQDFTARAVAEIMLLMHEFYFA